ncbi:MAG: OprO/OprP family phosphate-selective porin [Rhizobacter sp.]|nr:OprO/OprP family phosphate-selective porin [Rhizobacter sp.]
MKLVARALRRRARTALAFWLAFALAGTALAQAGDGKAPSPPAIAASAAEQAERIEGPKIEGGHIEGAKVKGEKVETQVTPNVPAGEEQGFKWTYGWEMWHGLDFSASQRTVFESTLSAVPILNFQEVKLAGSIGGRLEVDGAGYATQGSLTGFDDGFDLRRARLTAKGASIFGVGFNYRVDLGYVPGSFTVTQAYIGIPGVRYLGTVEFGQFTPPVGLQVLTSSWDIPFMEPAAPLQAMAPPSQPGVQAYSTFLDKRATWALGAYAGIGRGGDYGSGSKSFANIMGRTTGLVVDDISEGHPSANRYLHLGLSTNLQFSSGGEIRYRSRPESYLAPYVIDTGDIDASGAATFDAELLWVKGPFSAQGELIWSRIETTSAGILDFGGVYALASWYLTGESRPYERDRGEPGRLIPLRNFGFGPDAGWGALEAAARVSYTNLSDGTVQGGKLTMLMTSLNWYLRPELKCMFELGTGRVSGAASGNGRMVIGQLRMGVYFY